MAQQYYDGTGGTIFKTVTGINSTTQRTIIPDGTGDVTKQITGMVVISDGTNHSGGTFSLVIGASQDYAVGTLTLRFTVNANGSFTVHRQSGTGSGQVAVQAVWL